MVKEKRIARRSRKKKKKRTRKSSRLGTLRKKMPTKKRMLEKMNLMWTWTKTPLSMR